MWVVLSDRAVKSITGLLIVLAESVTVVVGTGI